MSAACPAPANPMLRPRAASAVAKWWCTQPPPKRPSLLPYHDQRGRLIPSLFTAQIANLAGCGLRSTLKECETLGHPGSVLQELVADGVDDVLAELTAIRVGLRLDQVDPRR